MTINTEYYGKIDPDVNYQVMCSSTRPDSYETDYLKTIRLPNVRCAYCAINNRAVYSYCVGCGAPLP